MESGVWEIANSQSGVTMAFLTMSMAEIFHSLNMRSLRGSMFKLGSANWVLYGAAAGTLVLTTVVCEIPVLANAFGFTAISFAEYLIAIGLGAMTIVIVETVKFFQRRIAAKRG